MFFDHGLLLLDDLSDVITVLTNENCCAESLSHRKLPWYSAPRRGCCANITSRTRSLLRKRPTKLCFALDAPASPSCPGKKPQRLWLLLRRIGPNGVCSRRRTQWPVNGTMFTGLGLILRVEVMRKTRPAVIVSLDVLNRALETVVVCPLTSRLHPGWRTRLSVKVAGKRAEIAADQIRMLATVASAKNSVRSLLVMRRRCDACSAKCMPTAKGFEKRKAIAVDSRRHLVSDTPKFFATRQATTAADTAATTAGSDRAG